LQRSRRPTKRLRERSADEEISGSQWLQDSLSHVKGLSDRVTEMSTLMGLSSLLSSKQGLPEALASVCQLCTEICRAQVSFIHLADDSDGDLVCISRHLSAGSPEHSWEGIARVYGRKALQRGEIIYSSEVLVRREDEEWPGRSQMGGICAVPLKGTSRPVGTLAVGYSNSHPFSAREKDMLSAVAAQVAMAVERSWLFDRLQEQLARANSLRKVATNVASNLELDAVLDSIVDQASGLLAAEFSAIFLVNAHDSDPQEAPGCPNAPLSSNLQLAEGPLASAVQQAVETGSPAVAQRRAADPPLEQGGDVKAKSYRSALAVPLLSGGEVLGALAVCYLDNRRFDSSDIGLAEDFASQAALAIRNARLYEEAMGTRLQLESALNQINNHGICLLDDNLNVTFANPATFWLLGVPPRMGRIAFHEWLAIVKKGLVEEATLDRAIEQIKTHPEEMLVTELVTRGAGNSPSRTIKLVSTPMRQEDGSIRGRINLLETARGLGDEVTEGSCQPSAFSFQKLDLTDG
jgi:GAF domain-containing protein